MRRRLTLLFLLIALFSHVGAARAADDAPLLLRGGVSMDSESAAEESQHEVHMDAIDSAEDGLEKAHESKLEAIEEQPDSDTKELQVRDENRKFERQKRDLERRRALENKRHAQAQARRNTAPASGPEKASSAGGKWQDTGIPGRLMKFAAEMDRAATKMQDNAMTASNEFCGGMARSLSKTAEFLAQKPGTVAPQMADAIVAYLTADYNENNERMYDDAVKAAEEIEKNPARFFGEHAVDIASSAAGGAGAMAEARAASAAGRLAAAEKAGMGRLEAMSAKQAEKLEKAGKRLEGMARDAGKFGSFSVKPGGGPDFSKIFPKEPSTTKGPVNIARALDPKAGNNNCFPVALAAAKRWKTGRPYVALDHNPYMPMKDAAGKTVYGDVATGSEETVKVLKRQFGGAKAKDPYHDGLKGLYDAREGWPVPSNQKKIRAAMSAGGDGSQGLVFVDGGEGTPGHVFNVRNNKGKVEFWDFQDDPPVQYLSFDENNVVMMQGIYRGEMNLDWKRVFFYRID
ncbi:MAG TPA: toxin glutamine deamidase domain-containing protein [Candidatus Eisenbacteria bacterium]|nr:toxin glutamine deamidase domain-containing protein [Candidatus Eisenbacteria bacterium]